MQLFTDTDIDDDRILLRIKLPDGGSRLILLSVATGMQVGTVDLKPSLNRCNVVKCQSLRG